MPFLSKGSGGGGSGGFLVIASRSDTGNSAVFTSISARNTYTATAAGTLDAASINVTKADRAKEAFALGTVSGANVLTITAAYIRVAGEWIAVSTGQVSGISSAQAALITQIPANTAKVGISASEKTDIADNKTDRHDHTNKTTLDRIGISADNKLTLNGAKVNIDRRVIVEDNLNSGSTINALSAKQGNVLDDKIDSSVAALESTINDLPAGGGGTGTGLTSGQEALIAEIPANTEKLTYPAADKTKLAGIEADATADQSGSEIKALYEAESNTNAFTDASQTKLGTIAENAEVNVQSNWNSGSGDALILNKPTTISNSQAQAIAANTAKRSYPLGDQNKLLEIEDGAQANVTQRDNDYTNASLNGSVITLTRSNGGRTEITIPVEGGGTMPALTSEALVTLIDSLNATQVAAVKVDLGVPAAQSTDDFTGASITDQVLTFVKRDGTSVSVTLPAASVADGSITTSKLANGAVTGEKITDGTIAGGKLATNTVSNSKISSQAISPAKVTNTFIETLGTVIPALIDKIWISDGSVASGNRNRKSTLTSLLALFSPTNKSVLDQIGMTTDNKLTFNSNEVDTVIAQRDVLNVLTSDNTAVSLAAAQGKVLDGKITTEKNLSATARTALGVRIDGVGSTYNLPDELDFLEANATLAGRSAFTDMSFATLAELSGNPLGFARQQNNLTTGNVEPDNESLIALYSTPTGASGANLRLEIEGMKLNTTKGLTLSNIGGGSPISFGLVYLGEVTSLVLPSRTVHAYRNAIANTFPRFVVGASKRVEIFLENGRALGWGTGTSVQLDNTVIDGYQTQLMSDLKLGAVADESDAADAVLLAKINALPSVSASTANGLNASVCYALDNVNNKIVGYSLVTGEAVTGRNLPVANWEGMALWNNFIILLNNTLKQAFWINATTLENVPSKNFVIGTETYQDIEVLDDVLHVLVSGNRTSAYNLEATFPTRVAAQDITLNDRTPAVSGNRVFMFTDEGVLHLVHNTGSYVGFTANGIRSVSDDGQISRLSSDRFSAGFAANNFDYFLETGSNKWQAHYSSNGIASPTHDIQLATSTYTGGCQGVLSSGASELDNLMTVTPIDSDKIPLRRTIDATDGSFDVTMGPGATGTSAGYAIDASGTLGGNLVEIFHRTGTLSQMVPGLVALFRSTDNQKLTLVLNKEFVGSATGRIDLTYSVLDTSTETNPTGNLDVFDTEVYLDNPSNLVADFQVFAESSPSLIDDNERNAWNAGRLLQNVTATLSDGRSISPVTPKEEVTESVLFSKLKEIFNFTAISSKLATIASGAEVNVQSDWDAGSGDALILNKPNDGWAETAITNLNTDYSAGVKSYSANATGLSSVTGTGSGRVIYLGAQDGTIDQIVLPTVGGLYRRTSLLAEIGSTVWADVSGGGSDTAAQILAKLLTVDGIGSNLDASFFNGIPVNNFFKTNPTNPVIINSRPIIFQNEVGFFNANTANAPDTGAGIILCFAANSSSYILELSVTATGLYYRTALRDFSLFGVFVPWTNLASGGAETATEILTKLLTIDDFNTFTDVLKAKLDSLGPTNLPEDLRLIAANSSVERSKNFTTIQLREAAAFDRIPLFSRARGSTYDTGYTDKGTITDDNEILSVLASNRTAVHIEVTEPLRLADGFSLDGTSYAITEVGEGTGGSAFTTNKYVYRYEVPGLSTTSTLQSRLLNNTNYVVKLKKADGDDVHWGAFDRVVMDKDIEVTTLASPAATDLNTALTEDSTITSYPPATSGAPFTDSAGQIINLGGVAGSGHCKIFTDNVNANAYLQFSEALTTGVAPNYNHRIRTEDDFFVSEERSLGGFDSEENELHLLGLLPSDFYITLIPQIALGNFALGTEIKINNDYRTATEGISVWADTVRVHYSVGPSGYRLSDEVLLTDATRNEWKVQFHANL